MIAVVEWTLMACGVLFLCSVALAAWLLIGACLEPRRRRDREITAHVQDLSDEELAEVLGRWAGSEGGQP